MRSLGMWLPIIEYADGYGFTYGARISFVDTLGPRSRISVPLTWEANAAPHFGGPRVRQRSLSRIEGGISISRRENHVPGRRHTPGRAHPCRARVDDVVARRRRDANAVSSSAAQANDTSRLDSTSSSIREWIRHTRATRSTWSRASSSYVSRASALSPIVHRVSRLPRADRSPRAGGSRHVDSRDRSAACPRQALLEATRRCAATSSVIVPATTWRRFPPKCGGPSSPLNIGRLGLKALRRCGDGVCVRREAGDRRFDRGIGAGVFFTATILRAGLDGGVARERTRRTAVAFRARRYLLIEDIQVGRVGKAVLAFDAFQERRVCMALLTRRRRRLSFYVSR